MARRGCDVVSTLRFQPATRSFASGHANRIPETEDSQVRRNYNGSRSSLCNLFGVKTPSRKASQCCTARPSLPSHNEHRHGQRHLSTAIPRLKDTITSSSPPTARLRGKPLSSSVPLRPPEAAALSQSRSHPQPEHEPEPKDTDDRDTGQTSSSGPPVPIIRFHDSGYTLPEPLYGTVNTTSKSFDDFFQLSASGSRSTTLESHAPSITKSDALISANYRIRSYRDRRRAGMSLSAFEYFGYSMDRLVRFFHPTTRRDRVQMLLVMFVAILFFASSIVPWTPQDKVTEAWLSSRRKRGEDVDIATVRKAWGMGRRPGETRAETRREQSPEGASEVKSVGTGYHDDSNSQTNSRRVSAQGMALLADIGSTMAETGSLQGHQDKQQSEILQWSVKPAEPTQEPKQPGWKRWVFFLS